MTARLAGGVNDQRHRGRLQGDDLAEVHDDVEISLGVDDVAENAVEARPFLEVDLPVDGDDDGPEGAPDGERGPRAQDELASAVASRQIPLSPRRGARTRRSVIGAIGDELERFVRQPGFTPRVGFRRANTTR